MKSWRFCGKNTVISGDCSSRFEVAEKKGGNLAMLDKSMAEAKNGGFVIKSTAELEEYE